MKPDLAILKRNNGSGWKSEIQKAWAKNAVHETIIGYPTDIKLWDAAINQTIQPPTAVMEPYILWALCNMMWNGALGPVLSLDTLIPEEGLCKQVRRLLRGQVLIVDGQTYVSKSGFGQYHASKQNLEVSIPFLSSRVMKHPACQQGAQPQALEAYLDAGEPGLKRPFVFMLKGTLCKEHSFKTYPLWEQRCLHHRRRIRTGKLWIGGSFRNIGRPFPSAHQGCYHHDSYVRICFPRWNISGHLNLAQ